MEQKKKFKFIWLLQPILVALFPALHMCARSSGEISFLHLLFIIILTSVSTSILFFLTSLIYKSYAKGALATNLLVISFYLSKILIDKFFVPISQKVYLFRVRYVVIILFFLLLYFLYKIYKTTIKQDFFLKALIVPFMILNIYAIYTFTIKKIHLKSAQEAYIAHNKEFREKLLELAHQVKSKKQKFPDIYFIILDMYTSDRILFKNFQHDNKYFTEKLNQIGFKVIKDGKSNYNNTAPSLAATLNMQYLPRNIHPKPYHLMRKDNNTKAFFENIGYTYFDLPPESYDMALFYDDNYFTTKQKEQTIWTEFKKFLFGQLYFCESFIRVMTPMHPFVENIYEYFRRESVFQELKILENIISYNKTPKFVYAHFFIPHSPCSFDEHGKPFPRQTKNESYIEWNRRGYIQATKFINKKIYPILEKIIKKSNDSIIILQGDHGRLRPVIDGLYILNACYLPKGGDKKLYSTITPVNNFRLVLNHYFGTDLPILEDK